MLELNPEQQKILSLILSDLQTKLRSWSFLKIFRFNSIKKGFYIYGLSGSGKTTLTNIASCKIALNEMRVVNMHFNDYFIDISRLIEKYTIKQIVKLIEKNLDVLCFDEFFIESIADAKILHTFFEELFKSNIYIILTSNFAPEELFKNGFNREIVFPSFSNLIYKKLNVSRVTSLNDYRLNLSKAVNIYCKSSSGLLTSLEVLLQVKDSKEQNLSISFNFKEIFNEHLLQTEDLQLDKANDKTCIENLNSNHSLIGVFDYKFLLKSPVSVKTFAQIARNHHIVCISNFSDFTKNNEDEAIRFRDLIDMLYLRSCFVVMLFDDISNQDLTKTIIEFGVRFADGKKNSVLSIASDRAVDQILPSGVEYHKDLNSELDDAFLEEANQDLHNKSCSEQLNSNNPDQIFDETLLKKKEFVRCVSRLSEMQSYEYINNDLRQQKRKWCDQARDLFENL